MTHPVSDADARVALGSIEQRRLQVIAEIDMPRWYWWGLALAWVALGVVADLAHPWATAAATLVFGAVHSAVAPRVLSGRHRSERLSVHADMVSRHLPALMFGCLVGLVAVNIGLGFLANADGADHPATMAGLVVAVAILCGGPSLMAAVRRRAEQKVVA
ncbi:MAG: hypothetical protein ACRD2C_00680 [Acidimicrobiales bacterium]